ncbi:MAG: response regulator [Thermodesulfobacteriota bacterium]
MTPLDSIRLLIVDDEQDFVESLTKRLRRRGIICDGALNGTEALSRLRKQHSDVVLLDMLLPDLDGNTVLREIKRQWPAIEVIILTGHVSVAAGQESLRAGAADYLVKPVELETLLDKLAVLAGRIQQTHNKEVAAGIPAGAPPSYPFQTIMEENHR